MALLRSDQDRSHAWQRMTAPGCLALAALGAAVLTAMSVARGWHPAVVASAWVPALAALVAWAVAVRVRRLRSRRGIRRVGQWVRCASICGGQIDGLAAVRAGGPLQPAEVAHGWLSLEAEVLRFVPAARCAELEAAWSVPWEALAVVDVRPATDLRTRLVPGLGGSTVTLRFRGRNAELRLQVEDDAPALLTAWQWWGVGERATRPRRADR